MGRGDGQTPGGVGLAVPSGAPLPFKDTAASLGKGLKTFDCQMEAVGFCSSLRNLIIFSLSPSFNRALSEASQGENLAKAHPVQISTIRVAGSPWICN